MQPKIRVHLTIRIDSELRERVRPEADRNRRTIGALVDAALAARGLSNAMASNSGP
jgi:predicted transcriptional regulator